MTAEEFDAQLERLTQAALESFGADDPRTELLNLVAAFRPIDPESPRYEQRAAREKFQIRCENVIRNL